MANSPLGVIKIPVDGAWDIENLRDLSESLSETYGLFYPLVAADEDTRGRLQDLIRKQFCRETLKVATSAAVSITRYPKRIL